MLLIVFCFKSNCLINELVLKAVNRLLTVSLFDIRSIGPS